MYLTMVIMISLMALIIVPVFVLIDIKSKIEKGSILGSGLVLLWYCGLLLADGLFYKYGGDGNLDLLDGATILNVISSTPDGTNSLVMIKFDRENIGAYKSPGLVTTGQNAVVKIGKRRTLMSVKQH